MNTQDLFKNNRSSKRLNESLSKTFGQKIDFQSFDTPKLEDARNKLRTQIYTARTNSGFNETIENEALTKAQWMHDAIVAELMDREEHIVDGAVQEESNSLEDKVAQILKRFDENMNEIGGYGDPDADKIVELLRQGDVEGATEVVWYAYADQDGGELRDMDNYIEDIEDQFTDLAQENSDDEGGETDDNYALASAGFGSDEDYESVQHEEDDSGQDNYDKILNAIAALYGDDIWDNDSMQDLANDLMQAGPSDKELDFIIAKGKLPRRLADIEFTDNDSVKFGEENEAAQAKTDDNFRAYLAQRKADKGGRDAYERDYDSSVSGMGRRERENDEGDTEPANNFAVSINGKQWKVIKGRGQYADDMAERNHYRQLQDMARRKSEATGKKWEVSVTGENPTESINYENKEQTGDNMSNLREGEIQQASAIVTAKTMVDRVGRWIEELSGMENDTLLQLGDSIRDEMGQEQAKQFISTVAPAIQSALENLKQARETLSGGVRTLTGEEQPEQMLGGTDAGEPDMSAEPDAMNAEPGAEDGSIDDFAAAEPATGGMETAGREQRESINRQNSLLKLLAG